MAGCEIHQPRHRRVLHRFRPHGGMGDVAADARAYFADHDPREATNSCRLAEGRAFRSRRPPDPQRFPLGGRRPRPGEAGEASSRRSLMRRAALSALDLGQGLSRRGARLADAAPKLRRRGRGGRSRSCSTTTRSPPRPVPTLSDRGSRAPNLTSTASSPTCRQSCAVGMEGLGRGGAARCEPAFVMCPPTRKGFNALNITCRSASKLCAE